MRSDHDPEDVPFLERLDDDAQCLALSAKVPELPCSLGAFYGADSSVSRPRNGQAGWVQVVLPGLTLIPL